MNNTKTANLRCERSAQLLEHRPLVRRVAHRLRSHMPPHVDMRALEQAGMIGLNEAMSRYEDDHGASFATYASRRIQGAMLDELRSTDRLSRYTRARLNLVHGAVNRMENRLGRAPRAKEVANELGWTLEAFHQCMADAGAGAVRAGDIELEHGSDEANGSDGSDEQYGSIDEHGDPLQLVQRRQRFAALSGAVEALDARERFVMEMTYDRELSLREIGVSLGISESRVCQIHEAILAKLKRNLRDW